MTQHTPVTQEDDNETKDSIIGMDFRAMPTKKQAKLFRSLISKAYLPERHLNHVDDFYRSEKLPIGNVSKVLYNDIFSARKFDRFGRLIPNRLTEKEKMVIAMRKNFENMSAGGGEEEPKPGETKAEKVPDLQTPTWKIGFKKISYGPPGLAPPLPYVLNSEGNERYFSYNGEWLDGKMTGEGKYKFADGMEYNGLFKNGKPHGIGKATYSSGTTYEGDWINGYQHGSGTCKYNVGTVYEGTWHKGKRHGFGKLTFGTGSYYEGDFTFGRFHGRGTYYSKDTAITYIGSFINGFVQKTGTIYYADGRKVVKEWPQQEALSFRKAVQLIEDERMTEANVKRANYTRLYGAIRALELQGYVDEVREDIKQERKEAKLAAAEEKRRLQREARHKERERRLQSLLDKDGKAIEGADEEVKMLQMEIENYKRGGRNGANTQQTEETAADTQLDR